MKQTLFLLMLTVFSSLCFSQPRVGFTAGANMANMYSKDGDTKDNGDYKAGFNIGLLMDIPITQSLSFQPALQFIQKGMKVSDGEDKVKINLNYIEIPLNLVYKAKAGNGNFFIGAGPYFATPIYSELKIKEDGESHKEDITFGKGESNDFRGFDLGANISTGYIMKNGFMISAFFSRGFYNLVPIREEQEKIVNQTFGIKIGFLFPAIAK